MTQVISLQNIEYSTPTFAERANWHLKSLLWKLKCSVMSDNLFLFTLKDGSRFYYPLNTAIGKSLFITEFEKQEIQIVEKFLKKGDVFIDVGANGGFYTVIASKIVGNTGHVYAFEPGIQELKLLRQNILANNLENVTIIEKAVSNEKGTARFAISKDGAMNSLLETDHPNQQVEEWQNVELTTLDYAIKEFSIKKINFIKIDVEGAEKFVLEGAKECILSDDSPIVLFESSDLTSPSFGYSTEELLKQVLSNNMFLYYIGEGNQLIPIHEYNPVFGGKYIYNFVASSIELNKDRN
jgi:FkbM family methyltransferase